MYTNNLLMQDIPMEITESIQEYREHEENTIQFVGEVATEDGYIGVMRVNEGDE